MAARKVHPVRTLIVFAVVVAALFGSMAALKVWTPRLGLDLRGGTTITLTAENVTGGGLIDPNSLEQARSIIEQRVNGLGVGEAEITTSGDRQIVVAVPNVGQDELVELVGTTAQLRFRPVYTMESVTPAVDPNAEPTAEPEDGNNRPAPGLPTAPPEPLAPRPSTEGAEGATAPDQALAWQPSEQDLSDFAQWTCGQEFPDVADQPLFSCDEAGTTKFLLGPTIISGEQVTDAQSGIPQGQFEWVVSLEFNSEGSAQFEEATRQLAAKSSPQNQFAIVLDGNTISAPSVDQAIPGGQAQISGSFTQASAESLAQVLRYGALPLSFTVDSVDTVSPTLGAEQLNAGLIAGAVGLLIVLAYCVLYYRALALVVFSTLSLAAVLTYQAMVLLGPVTGFALNLPAVAGAVVAIGLTADSFVIFYAKIRDEVQAGRTLRSAVETGWDKSKRTILIANAVSLLSAVVLFILAIGAIRGFAFTLALTTVIDLAVAFWFTKPLMTLLARTQYFGSGKHRFSGLSADHMGVRGLPGRRPATAGEEA
ncbi:protein translocase subunit SecD [Naumannella halotolerans]|uniref:Protein translocase subunit SecD n=1 Tax=Naumannella halotolerans TaxID=993414 RepID=A0A4R7JA69_9ACTN|nr:protein translocase subunit SecD [Naumannella halotolerans]TDT33507.1 preprotein translocase subunit SecD [Naumannella halotolerans]